jgi:hypothetical protein
MNPRVTVGLLVVLLALGAYSYFGTPPPGPAGGPGAGTPGLPTPDPSLDLWTIDESQIQAVSVKRGDQEAGVQRAGDDWTLTPSGEPADKLRVYSLVFRLARNKATYRLSNPPSDTELGLATPSSIATITLASGETHTLTMGGKAPAESGTYVRKDSDTSVYLVSNALAQDVERIVTEPPRPPSPTPLPSPSPEGAPSPAP